MFRFFRRKSANPTTQQAHDLDAEIAFHVEQRTRRLESQGLSSEEARQRALARFGDPARVKQSCVTERRRALARRRRRGAIAGTFQDLRFGIRTLHANAGFSGAVITILALGIGASTAVFGIVNQVVLKPLPYANPGQLVAIEREHIRGPEGPAQMSPPDLAELLDRIDGATVTALDESIILPLVGADTAIHVTITPTLPDYFDVIGVRPILGHDFDQGADLWTTDDGWAWRQMILSYELWQREFGGDPNVLGRKLALNNVEGEVIGVMPPGFLSLMPRNANTAAATEVWYPVQWDYRDSRVEGARMRGLARLKEGTSIGQLQAELATVAVQLEDVYAYNKQVGKRFRAVPLQSGVTDHVKGSLGTFAGGVGLVLLIACANVANLLLVNGGRRQRELAVRAALGASQGRLVRQLLAETLVLGGVSAIAGLALASSIIAMLRANPPRDLPRVSGLSLDLPTFAFALVVALAAVLLASLPPLVRSARDGMGSASTQRTSTDDRQQQRTQGALVIAEVAFSIVLLAGAGLMLRSFAELRSVPLGFEHEQLLTLNTTTIREYGDDREITELAIVEGLAALPGVEAVGVGFPLPLNGVYDRSVPYRRAEAPADSAPGSVYFRTISPGYLEALGVELLAGRLPISDDSTREFGRVVIDDRLAAQTWPGETAIGKRLWMGENFALDDWPADYAVVGVVRYVPQGDHRDRKSTVYVGRQLYQSVELGVAIRTSGDPAQLAGAAREVLRKIDPNMPVDVVRMNDLIAGSLAGATFDVPGDCTPSEPVHVLQIHGTLDATIGYGGGAIGVENYPGAIQTVETWATYDSCSPVPDLTPPPIDLDAGLAGAETTVRRYAFGCSAGARPSSGASSAGATFRFCRRPSASR